MLRILLSVLLLSFTVISYSDIPSSFNKAKKLLYTEVYDNNGYTIYTGCYWYKKKVDLESCGLEYVFPKKWRKRAKRIEAEHIIPASWMYKKNGYVRQCFMEAKELHTSARKYCRQNDKEYRNAHNDLVNLYPVIGAINAFRSNKPFSIKSSGSDKYTIDGNKRVVITSRAIIPDPTIRGDISRIALYMQRHYGVQYSRRLEELFWIWDKQDPISDEEKQRCMVIRSIQGRCVFD